MIVNYEIKYVKALNGSHKIHLQNTIACNQITLCCKCIHFENYIRVVNKEDLCSDCAPLLFMFEQGGTKNKPDDWDKENLKYICTNENCLLEFGDNNITELDSPTNRIYENIL